MSGGSGETTPEEGAVVETDGEGNLAESVEVVETNDAQEAGSEDEWTWKRIDAENKRGLEYAEHFAALDSLNKEFSGSSSPALGKFRDFLW
jgi:hypothetical protein